MVKITENSDEIVIEFLPIKEWMLAGILSLLFCFCSFWLICLFFFNPQNFLGENLKSWMDGTLIIIIILITLTISLDFKILPIFRVFRASFTILKIDQKAKNIEIFRQWLYTRQTERYYLSQVSKVKSYKVKKLFFESYFLVLILANQKEIKFKIPIGDKKEATNLVRKFNKLIKTHRKP